MSVSSNRGWFSLVLAALLVAAPSVARAQAAAPAAAFAFGEGAGDAFGDSSGSATGTLSGATWAAGRFGSGLAFDGLDDFATVSGGAGFEPTTGMTLEAWVYPTLDSNGLDDGGGAIVLKEDASGASYALFTKGRNARFAAKTTSSGSLTEVRAFSDLPLNTWSHLAAVFDGSTLRLYVNGTLTAWKPRAGALVKSTGAVRIGGVMQNETFAGRIDEVRLYRRALPPTEIQADMAAAITPLPGPDVDAPSVSITSPAPGATVAGTISVTANASDNKGVAGVQFLLDGVPIGAEVTSAPYAMTFDTHSVTNTIHTLSARARDTAGNIGTMLTGVAVSVYNPPTLTITQPVAGASFNGEVVNVAYTTVGDLTGVDHVHFRLADGAEIEDPTFDGLFQLTGLPEGAHVLTAVLARADHSALPATQAAPVSFNTVMPDVAPPVVAVVAPAAGTSVSGTVTVIATASDATGVAAVQFLLDGEPLGAEDTSYPYEITWDTRTATNTGHGLSARARDTADNVGATIRIVMVSVYNAPTLTITRPTAGASIDGGTLDIAYTTAGDLTGVDHVRFRLDNGTEAQDSSVDGQFQLTGLNEGSHVLTAVLARADQSPMPGTDAAPVSFETILPDVTAPVITFAQPGADSTVANTITVTATATDARGVVAVQFLLDGAPLGAEMTGAPYAVTWDTHTATNTTHTLTANARDAAGNLGTTAINVVVYNPATLTITQPSAGGSIDGDVVNVAYTTNGDLTGVDHVHFRLADGAELEDPSFDGVFQLTGVAEGSHVLTGMLVRADHSPLAGTGAAPVSFATVMPDVTAPVIALTGPAADSPVANTVSVTATATDAKGVVAVQFLLDGAPLGAEVTSAPYAVAWDTHTTTNTTHTLTARARDAAGNVGTTATAIAVTVYNPAKLTITQPAAGASVDGDVVSVAYTTAGDLTGVHHVHFRLDSGAELDDASLDGLFQLTGVAEGAHVLSAVLVRADHSGMPGTDAAPVSFHTVMPDVQAPVITLTTPAAGDSVDGSVKVAATASDDKGVVGVQFLLDGQPLGAEVTGGAYVVVWDTHTATNTTHTLTARARDAAGNIGTTSAGVAVTVYNPPTLTITQPVAGASINATVVNVAYTTSGDLMGVDHVHFLLDEELEFEDPSFDNVFQLTDVGGGTHVLTAVLVRGDHSPLARTEAAPVSFETIPPDEAAPVVTLTAPAADATVAGTVTVTATASDKRGVVGVQFLLDGAALGAEVTSAPYAVTWDTQTATNTTHTLTARARDAAGNVGTTDTGVVVHVYNPAKLTITQPAAGASIDGDTVTVAYTTAGDLTGVDHVHFRLADGAALEDPTLDGQFQLTEVAEGSHVLTAVLVRADHSPLSGTEAAPASFATVMPDVTAPAITLTAPAADATVANTVTVTATATDAKGVTGVQFLLDGAPLGAEVTTAPYAVTWDTQTATNTTHTLTARARDAAGNVGTTTTGVVVSVYNPAKLTITQPAGGASFEDDVVSVAYTTAGDLTGVHHVHFRLDGGAELEDDSLDGQFQLTAVAAGTHALTAVLARADHTPLAGTDAAPVSFDTVAPDRTAPVITLTAPAPDATVANTISVTVTATDAKGVVGVQFLLDGAPLGAEVTSAPYAVTWDTQTATNTTHTLTARARDAAGNVGTTDTGVVVHVYNPARLTITQPAAGASIDADTATVAYTTAGDLTGVDHVHFRLGDGAELEDPSVDGAFQLTGLADGPLVLTAMLVRADHSPLPGTEAAPVSFTVAIPDTIAPVITLTAPAADATVANTITLTATATDAKGVTGVQFLLDGAPLGAEVTTAPYAVTWDTQTATNTTHTLTARARDAAGNVGTTTTGVVVSVYNPAKLTITQPAGGASFEDDVVSVAYTTAGDLTGVHHVHFRLDGGAELEDDSLDGQFQLTAVAAGTHALTAVLARADHTPLAGTDAAPVSFDTVAPDRTAPVITLTAPAPDATVANTISVTVTATDAKGVVGVQFLLDGAPLGAEVTSAPYAVTWDTQTATNTTHTLTARARDAAGNVGTTTTSVVVNVYNPAKLTITQPAAGGSIDGELVNVAYTTAGDLTGVDHVHFRLGEGAELEDPTLDGQFQLTAVSEGTHALTAVLVRADHSPLAGTDAAPVSFTTVIPDVTAPVIMLTAPAADATVANTITVTATATDAKGVTGVQFLLDGAPLGAEVTTAPYAVTWDTQTATNTTHTLTARARDAAGNVGTTTTGVVVTVYNAAKLTITQPAAGASIDGDVVNVAYTIAGDLTGVHHVHFRLDGGADLEDPTLDNQFQLTNVTDGSHALVAVLVRADHSPLAGTDAAAVSFGIVLPDTTAPVITLTAPVSDTTVAGTIAVMATATDAKGVTGVQFLLDGAPLGAEVASSPYEVTWDTRTATNATHTLSARARDAAGNVGTSAPVLVTVDNRPPKLTITQPTAGATVNGATVNVAYTTTGNLTGVDHVHFRLDDGSEVMDLSLDGVYQFTAVAPGAHVLTGYLVLSNHSKIAGTDAQPVSFTTVMPDMTAPAVTLTAPTNGATVSGSITVMATATDDTAVAGVQFLLDGADLGARDTAPPYAIAWQTAAVPVGAHTLTAVAYDSSGNAGISQAVSVTVTNLDPGAQTGKWGPVMNWPLVAVHGTLMHTGEILLWDGWEAPALATVWNPTTNEFRSVTNQSGLFCSAHSMLPDGRIFVSGGHAGGEVGIVDANSFDPVSSTWTTEPNMSSQRWYPSNITLSDGRVLVLSGQITPGVWADTPEIYDPTTSSWTRLNGVDTGDVHDPEYLQTTLLPDGRIAAIAASTGQVRVLDVALSTWTDLGTHPELLKTSLAMYRPGRILATGGGDIPNGPSDTRASVIDFNDEYPEWRQIAPMAFPRYNHTLVTLADGSVLAVGGARIVSQTTLQGTLAAELWNPVTETWQTMTSMRDPRMYHSIAMLLPDGRVLSAGGGRLGGARDYFTAQIFSPPYLFKGTRPTIVSAPSLLPLGSTATVQTLDASDIASVALVRLPSVTHMLDMDQRYLPLSFTASGDRLTITAPPSAELAPAGYYMLFIINSNGVPSTSAILRVPTPQEDVQAPLPPQNLGAAGATSAVTLMWDASADNSGVVAYNVHRSSTPGFTPSALNQVARVNALFYTDFVAGGTYTYVVTAEDAAGNVSAPSNEAVATALADTTLPQVAITQPATASVVSGVVTITAGAFDNVVVAGVRFLVNGATIGSEAPEDTTAPYSVAWNTRSVVNGTYTLTAVARDGSGNQTTSAPITVTVNNTAPVGLVAAYGFEEGTGNTVGDNSGFNNVGAISGATWVTGGRFGKALSFDGVNDVVSVNDADSLDVSVGMTLEAWVNPRSLGDFSTILMKEQFNDVAYVLYANSQYFGEVANRPSIEIKTSSNVHTAFTSQLPLNTWTHVAATYDGKELRLYINGSAVLRAVTGPIVQSSRELRIGGNLVWGEYFDGLIDEVRIYNRALTQQEIQADRNAAVQPQAVQP